MSGQAVTRCTLTTMAFKNYITTMFVVKTWFEL